MNPLKKLTQIFTLFALCLMLTACPYESAVPAGEAKEKVNSRLTGSWKEPKENLLYKVAKKDDVTYEIEESSDGKSKPGHFLAFTTEINGVLFLNVYSDRHETPEKKYMIYKLEPDNNSIKIYAVTENIREKFSSSEELRKFIEANMKNSYFFEREAVLVRPGPKTKE